MKFEIVGAGFDGGGDTTDDRIIWVSADNEGQVQEAVTATGATYGPLPQHYSSKNLDYELPADMEAVRQRLIQYNVEAL